MIAADRYSSMHGTNRFEIVTVTAGKFPRDLAQPLRIRREQLSRRLPARAASSSCAAMDASSPSSSSIINSASIPYHRHNVIPTSDRFIRKLFLKTL
jgi:hypothetical protein